MSQLTRKNASKSQVKRCAFGYVRVSTEKQAIEGQSLDVQREQIAAICTLNGWELVDIFADEGVSASVPFRQRPAGAKLWEAIAEGAVIIALKLDRAFRDVADAGATLKACQERGVGLVLGDLGMQDVTSGAVSALIFSIMSAVASFERQRIAERIGEAKASQKAKGAFLGGSAPFGYRVSGVGKEAVLEADTALQGRVLALHRRGDSSRMIVAALKIDMGLSTTPNAICKFLREHVVADAA